MSPVESDRAALHPELTPARRELLLRRGVELFNAGRFFDAHEPWEEIWRSRSPEPRHFFKGLVQVAAGLHIWHERGRAAPATRVLRRGMQRLEPFRPAALGIDVEALLEALEPWLRGLEAHGRPPTSIPRIEPAP